MSNALAIAAATASLRALLASVLEPLMIEVSVLPPEKAAQDVSKDRVNIFLYQATTNAAWRNMDMPRQLQPGETGFPPLPLALSYLLTAYSGQGEIHSQQALGRAMSVLHDRPLLDHAFIKDATDHEVEGSDLHEQVERLRITLQPEPLDELSKLWTALQTQYRTSAAYQVSVVLIESTRPAKAPLPVLQRGKDDTGVASQPDVGSPFPALSAVDPPSGQTSARLGDVVTITGQRLDAATVDVRVSHPRLPGSGPVTILPDRSATEVKVALDDDAAHWVAGLYSVAVILANGDDLHTTNELPLTLAPRIETLPPTVQRKSNPGHPDHESAEIKLTFSPQLRPGQRAVLLIGDREVPPEPLSVPQDPTGTLTFVVKHASLGMHFVRLRIDGVDSLLVQRPPNKPPVFDPQQAVTIHD